MTTMRLDTLNAPHEPVGASVTPSEPAEGSPAAEKHTEPPTPPLKAGVAAGEAAAEPVVLRATVSLQGPWTAPDWSRIQTAAAGEEILVHPSMLDKGYVRRALASGYLVRVS